jgi:hypothetical protein
MPDAVSRLLDAAAGMEALAVMLDRLDDKDIALVPPNGLATILELLGGTVQAVAEELMDVKFAA